MATIKLDRMEDILTIPADTESVTIDEQEVLYFLYKQNSGKNYIPTPDINISEVRDQYITRLKGIYNKREPLSDTFLTFKTEDIIKIRNCK